MIGDTPIGSESGSGSPVVPETTADQLRAEMTRLHTTSRATINAWADYAERMEALLVEYHRKRLQQTFPKAEIIDSAGVLVYDLRSSPKSADVAFLQLEGGQDAVQRIIWDWKEKKAYLLTK